MTKKFRPTTPGQRWLVLPSNNELTREGRKTSKPHKPLLASKKRTNGRNHHGHVTCRHRGGGHKRFYRSIDFIRDKGNIPAKVASIEYAPNQTAQIALFNHAYREKP
ncbi:MAG: 50S ribosomal protein L2 [Chlamydiae bacterium]|nr:50S ribosomal protein L2 [Chlamydiota bacterium]